MQSVHLTMLLCVRVQMSASQVEEMHELVARWLQLEQRTRDALAALEAEFQQRWQANEQGGSAAILMLRQLIEQQQKPEQEHFTHWQIAVTGILANASAASEELKSVDIQQTLGAIVALCALGHGCIACIDVCVNVFDLRPSGSVRALHADVCKVAEAAGNLLLAQLQQLSADALADIALSHTQAQWITLEPHVALRLIELGMPVGSMLDPTLMADHLRIAVYGSVIDRHIALELLSFGLDPSDAPLDSSQQQESSISIARRVVANEDAEHSPVHSAELVQQTPLLLVARARLPLMDRADRLSLTQQNRLRFCVLVHEWRLHSAAVRAQLLESLSSPSNDAALEVRLIADYLDLKPAEKQQQQASVSNSAGSSAHAASASAASASSSASAMEVV